MIHYFVLGSNPFFEAYIQSDFLGKCIFIGLLLLSIISWIILLHKSWITYQARKYSAQFHDAFQLQKLNPLSLDTDKSMLRSRPNPFLDLYRNLKQSTVEILTKNHHFTSGHANPHKSPNPEVSFLSPADIEFVEGRLQTTIASEVKDLEKNLFILSTIVSLAPFLGLLGTVWGILTTFSELQLQGAGGSHQMVLGGLSLALATTVLGLIDAIPALIGYNYLKNTVRDFQIEMEKFASELLASVEMQYRKVDVD